MVPHGMAVALTAPEAFRWTFEAAPERHLRAAELLDPGHDHDGPEALPQVLAELMRDIGIPNGLGAVGYGEGDIGDLVEGAMKQPRRRATAPREGTPEDAEGILRRSLTLWGATPATCSTHCAGTAGATPTPPPWPGRSTPATPASTGCRRRWWCVRGRPPRSRPPWPPPGRSAHR